MQGHAEIQRKKIKAEANLTNCAAVTNLSLWAKPSSISKIGLGNSANWRVCARDVCGRVFALRADVEREPDFLSALPNSVSITNTGPVTLRDVAVSFGLCRAMSDGGASVIGRPNPARCNGSAIKGGNGIARILDWEGHTLVVNEKWTLSLPVKFASFGKEKLAVGDVDYIVTFWAWPIPIYRHTVEFRFATQRQPNGNLIWAQIPVD